MRPKRINVKAAEAIAKLDRQSAQARAIIKAIGELRDLEKAQSMIESMLAGEKACK